MTAAAAIVQGLIGKPYCYGGRGPDGYDCWGLVLTLRERLGRRLPPDWASRALAPAHVRAFVHGGLSASGWQQVPPQHGVIVYSPRAAHAGVLLFGQVVHAAHRAGVVAWRRADWVASFDDSEFWEWLER